ncbi:MAG: 6-bladed beta-propeller [Tannerellaceae bacterium]|jgi:hypothetical protein|nr:6-bladed beta-propeller [Tannerellaceae bacterium]
MKTIQFFIAATVMFVLASCSLNQVKQTGELTASVREALNSPATLPIADEIELAEYIPLEVTDNDASLIDGVVDFAITSKYIYVLVSKEARIVLFDRQGHFLRTFLQQGQGPNDFRGMIGFIQANEANNRFYVIGSKMGIYTLEGEFVEDFPINHPVIYAHHLGNSRIGAISMPFMSFQDGSFGVGVFREDGETIMTKNDFYSPLVPKENSGFTFGVMGSPSDGKQSVLFKMASNDTIFRLSADTIQPALVAGLGNSDEEVIRGLNIRDIKKFPADGDIFVTDILETPRRYYLRMMLNKKYYVASVDKQSGETVVEQCDTPEVDASNLSDFNIQLGMVGSKGYKQFPIWGRILGNNLVQVVTPYEIEMFKKQTKIVIPQELQMRDVDANPIFIIYKVNKI